MSGSCAVTDHLIAIGSVGRAKIATPGKSGYSTRTISRIALSKFVFLAVTRHVLIVDERDSISDPARTGSHEITRAIMNAAAAANPPMRTVWLALRSGGAPVK
jgi:hypothetical protein